MLSIKQLFREEKSFLRKEGNAFAKENPDLAQFLSDEMTDPDIERLMEGFAFLSARLRQKIQDDFPELTHSIINLLWPNYLRPVPSCTMMKFDPEERAITNKQVLEKGLEIQSVPVDGTPCVFRTTTDVALYPFRLHNIDAAHTREKTILKLNFNTIIDTPLNTMDCDEFTLHFSGSTYQAQTNYLWFFHYLSEIRVNINGETKHLSKECIERVGFDAEEALLPYPANTFDGYRILQEYFMFEPRFHFVKLKQLLHLWPNEPAENFEFEFHFSRPMPDDMRLTIEDYSLFCAPAVNLFEKDLEPISVDGRNAEYRVFPATGDKRNHFEIFNIETVTGSKKDKDTQTEKLREYPPFESFKHEVESGYSRKAVYFRTRVKEPVTGNGLQHYLSFVRNDANPFDIDAETISIGALCTNQQLPEMLAVGDICHPTQTTPSYMTFTNITRPTSTVAPIVDSALHWTLISNFSLNYLSLLRKDLLSNVIRCYDLYAMHDLQAARRTQQRIDGIQKIDSTPIDILIKGTPARGIKSKAYMDESKFSCEGDMYLFATVLSHFFSLYASINSFHLMELVNTENQEHYDWPLRTGSQPVI